MLSWQPTTRQVQPREKIEQLSLVNRQRAWVEIDLKALAHNVRQIKQILAPATELMAVVKADAYGHGEMCIRDRLLP